MEGLGAPATSFAPAVEAFLALERVRLPFWRHCMYFVKAVPMVAPLEASEVARSNQSLFNNYKNRHQ